MKLLMLMAIGLLITVGSVPAVMAQDQQTQSSPDRGGYNPPKPKEGFRYPDCFCTDSEGRRIEIGQTTCLKIGSNQVTARCGMSLNNPIWRHLSKGCPSV